MNPSTLSSTDSSIIMHENQFEILQNKKEKEKQSTKWTKEEDEILLKKANEYHFKKWKEVASFLPGHSSIQCSARFRRIKKGIIKGNWKKEEDDKLLELYKKYGKNWSKISKEMKTRTGKQIRDRFLNSLDERVIKRKFNNDEDEEILNLYKKYGNCWSLIAKNLKGRTGDMVKNRFYSKLIKIIKNDNSISTDWNLNDNSVVDYMNLEYNESFNHYQFDNILIENNIKVEDNENYHIFNINLNNNENNCKLDIETIENQNNNIFHTINLINECSEIN
jgi:hypothetical protein